MCMILSRSWVLNLFGKWATQNCSRDLRARSASYSQTKPLCWLKADHKQGQFPSFVTIVSSKAGVQGLPGHCPGPSGEEVRGQRPQKILTLWCGWKSTDKELTNFWWFTIRMWGAVLAMIELLHLNSAYWVSVVASFAINLCKNLWIGWGESWC